MVLTFLLAVTALLLLILLEVPIAFALLISGAFGIVLAQDAGVAGSTLGSLPFSSTASYSLAVIPMYILMGSIAARAGLARDLFDIASRHLRKLPGGLAVAGIAGCAGFAAVTGSSVATVASVGRTAVEQMRRHGYDVSFAAGAIAAAGTLGVLIPPSIVIVLFGIVTGTSIGALLAAGVIPGVLTAISYAAVAIIKAKRSPASTGQVTVDQGAISGGPDGTSPAPPVAAAPSNVTIEPRQYVSLAKVGVLFAIVVGGVYSGLYTATEAGGIGAVAALLILWSSHSPEGRFKASIGAFEDSARLTGSVLFIVVGGAVFTYFVVAVGVPSSFAEWASGLPVPGIAIVMVLLLAMVPLGMILDALSITLIFVPIIFPIIEATGHSGVWFGILCVKMIEIGMITPPVGMNAFVIAGSVPGVKAEQVFVGVLPFIFADVAVIGLIFLFPDIVLFLPSLVGL